MDRTTILPESQSGLGTRADEDRVEHGGAHTFEVVIWHHTLSRIASDASRENHTTARGDEVGDSTLGLEGSTDSSQNISIEAVGDEDSDAAASDGRGFREEVKLRKTRRLLAVVGVLDRFSVGFVSADHLCDGRGEFDVDVAETLDHALVNDGVITVVEFESKGALEMHFFDGGEGVVEKLGLVEVLLELGSVEAELCAGDGRGKFFIGMFVAGVLCVRSGFEAVRPIVDGSLMDAVVEGAVAVEVHDGADRAVDGELLPVDSETGDLGVEVGEVTALEKRIVGETDTGDDVGSAESDLLGFGEELIDIAVEGEFTNVASGDEIFWPDLGCIKNVEIELILIGLGNNLDTELPLGVGTVLDGFHEILAVEVGVLTSKLQGLIPNKGVNTELRGPDELDKVTLALVVNEREGYAIIISIYPQPYPTRY